MSYVSLIKNLPELFGQPAGIATIASVGLHGALALILPLMSTPASSKPQETTTNTVGLMEVPPSDLSRIAQASSAPKIGLPPQNQLKPQLPSSLSILGQPTPPPPGGNGNLSVSVLDQPNVVPNPAALSQLQGNGKPYNTSRIPQQGRQFNLSSPENRLMQSNPGNIAFSPPNLRSSNNPNTRQSPAASKKYFLDSNPGLVTPANSRRNVIPSNRGPNGQPVQPDLYSSNLGREVPSNRGTISVDPQPTKPQFEIPSGGTSVPQVDVFSSNISGNNNIPPNTNIAVGPNNNSGFPGTTDSGNSGFPITPGINNPAPVIPGSNENLSNSGNTPAVFTPSTLKNPGELPEATISGSGSSPIISARPGTTPDGTGNFNIPTQPGTPFTPSAESKNRDDVFTAYNSWHNSEDNKNVFSQFIKEKINSPLLTGRKQDNVLVSATVDEKNNIQISPLLAGNISPELKAEIEKKVREHKFPDRDKKTTYKFQFTIFGGEGNTAQKNPQETPQETPEKVTNFQQQNSPQANTSEKTTPEAIKSPEVNKAPRNEDKPSGDKKPSLGERLRDSRSQKSPNSSSENESVKKNSQSFRPSSNLSTSNLPTLESPRIPSVEFSKPSLSTTSNEGKTRLNFPAPARGNEVSQKIERRPLAKLDSSNVSPRVNKLIEQSPKKPDIKVNTEIETSPKLTDSGSRQTARIESNSEAQESSDRSSSRKRLLQKMRQRMQENKQE
jgi:hypothetical protein